MYAEAIGINALSSYIFISTREPLCARPKTVIKIKRTLLSTSRITSFLSRAESSVLNDGQYYKSKNSLFVQKQIYIPNRSFKINDYVRKSFCLN